MDDETSVGRAPAAEVKTVQPEAKPTELRNSLWCVHTTNGRVGMINELHSGVAKFHYAGAEGELEEVVNVRQEELRPAKRAELPANHGLTEQQCTDIGYL